MDTNKFTTHQFRLMYITQGKSVASTKSEIAEVLRGGCKWIQVRMKEAALRDIEDVAAWALPYCLEYGAILIVNDHPMVALHANAHGIHIGKSDPSITEVRKLLGSAKIIGTTANTIKDILEVNQAKPDYHGVGPFRFTTTKKNLSPNLDYIGYVNIIKELKRFGISTPWTAIGGITLHDLAGLRRIGISSVAVSGDIANDINMETRMQSFIQAWEGAVVGLPQKSMIK
jgi:thiamine-phosphate pyrophosphorylase